MDCFNTYEIGLDFSIQQFWTHWIISSWLYINLDFLPGFAPKENLNMTSCFYMSCQPWWPWEYHLYLALFWPKYPAKMPKLLLSNRSTDTSVAQLWMEVQTCTLLRSFEFKLKLVYIRKTNMMLQLTRLAFSDF